MNKIEKSIGQQAELVYGDSEYHVVRPGSYVVCAVTGVHIPLDELRYWSVAFQEAYATPEASLQRVQQARLYR